MIVYWAVPELHDTDELDPDPDPEPDGYGTLFGMQIGKPVGKLLHILVKLRFDASDAIKPSDWQVSPACVKYWLPEVLPEPHGIFDKTVSGLLGIVNCVAFILEIVTKSVY